MHTLHTGRMYTLKCVYVGPFMRSLEQAQMATQQVHKHPHATICCRDIVPTEVAKALGVDVLRCRMPEDAQHITAQLSSHGRTDSSKAICVAEQR